MSDVVTPAVETAAMGTAQAYDPKAGLRSILVSIFVNGVLPYITYKVLVSHFAAGSILPLLCASVFPVLGLAVTLVRTRTVDAIASFAIFGIVYNITSTLLAGEVHLALIVGATQGYVLAPVFAVSALIGRPIVFYIVRQFAAGNDAAQRARFAAVNEADGGRTFFIATMVWAVGIALLSTIALVLALIMKPAPYLLVNNIINTGVNVLLVIWSIRFISARLAKVGERMAAAQAA